VRLARRRSWQQHGQHAGGLELAQCLFSDSLQVVGGDGAQLRGQRCTGAGSELLGMDAQAQAVTARGDEHGSDFVDGEGVIVTEASQ